MRSDILIGDKTVALVSNGATVLYYRNIFSEDFLKFFSDLNEGKISESDAIEPLTKLTYVMHLQALATDGDKTARSTLRSGGKSDGYLEWLEEFNPLDIPLASQEILTVYTGNLEELESPKKE